MNTNKVESAKALHSEDTHAGLSSTKQAVGINLVSPREGESMTQARFRANRLFSSGSAWYFSTREGQDQGPFISKEQAEKAIYDFIQRVSS